MAYDEKLRGRVINTKMRGIPLPRSKRLLALTHGVIGLVQQPGWLLNKSRRFGEFLAEIRQIYPFFSGSCSITEVIEQLYYAWKTELEAKGKGENRYPKTREGNINREKVREMVEKHPDWYIREFAGEIGIWFQAVDKRCKTLGLSRKKDFYGNRSRRLG